MIRRIPDHERTGTRCFHCGEPIPPWWDAEAFPAAEDDDQRYRAWLLMPCTCGHCPEEALPGRR